ncbi:LacI family DNA-binding transcriptional regulator [Microbacterium deminutum]|uniref:LacI family DNA-binding transcriptional regulator n=1 Tax=Microbacterium deminutum TaxID=344164 RepID=A0ABP5CIC0_9MICO
MATIGDVAKYAGVSRSTVSHALSGKRPISLETRQRISEAIVALQYTANAGAKALATSKTSTLGLIVPYTPAEFAPARMQYVMIVSETARELGFDVLMVTDFDGRAGIKRVTDSSRVDGVILLNVTRHDERIGSVLAAAKPGVLIGLADDNAALDSVDLDFAAAGRSMVRHLAERGHRRVIFVTLPTEMFLQDLGYVWRLHESVIDEAQTAGLALTVVHDAADPKDRMRVLAGALDATPDATALLVHSVGALIDLPVLLSQRRISVPRDLSVVGLFGDEFGAMFALPYTAVEPSPEVVVSRAVHLVAERIEDPSRPVVQELLAPLMVDRGSTREV